MQKIFATIGLVIFVLLSSSAQDVAPVPAPPDVALKLGTEADLHRFHLGELIPTTFSYSASIPGRYIWVTRSSTLAGGRSVEITCKPAAEPVSGIPKSGPDLTFAQLLIAPCGGVGGSAYTYLDTLESLAKEVKLFDGRSHGWNNGFWDAIQHSSTPEQAVRLMSARIQEPDFEVSQGVLEWLASSALRIEVPGAFESGAPATYHAQAVEKLRMYVRLLGGSLNQKNSTVLNESVKTYSKFAEPTYCEAQPLIPTEEQNNVLAGRAATP
jgi:hypothetical protein